MHFVIPRRHATLVVILLAVGLPMLIPLLATTRHALAAGPPYLLYLPAVKRAASSSAPVPPGVTWDPRLNLRMAMLIPAQVAPGEGYWQLVEGVWFDVTDTRPMGVGDCDIAVDVQDAGGVRQLYKPLKVMWFETQVDFYTQDKRGEKYSGIFPMSHVAPTYTVAVDDGAPSDAVAGLGLGTIEHPGQTFHSSYGFIWRWTIAGATTTTPSVTPDPSVTPTTTPVPPPGTLSWDPRLDRLNTVLVPAGVEPGQGYWRLVKGVWYDLGEGPFPTQSLVLVDTLDASGNRQTGVPVAVRLNDGSALLATLRSEIKTGDLYAADFQMTELRPTYRVQPADGAPADLVYNLGQGSITQPDVKLPTSYGFTWQWTIAP